MEIEKTPNEYAKKMWKIVRIMFCMMRKSMAKSKLDMLANLHMLLERGKIAIKAMIGNLVTLHHDHHHHQSYYSALTCRPDDITASFISPREYEFSCRSSPIFPSKHKSRHHHSRRQAEEFKLMQKALRNVNMNRYDGSVAKSPLLPGFGQSPMAARQRSVTDSPFPAKEVELSHQVDRDAEEFIKKFYKDLRIQKRIAALESPSPYHMWAS